MAILDDTYPPEVRGNILLLTLARLWANAGYRFALPFLATIARGLDVSLGEISVAITITELLGLGAPVIGRLVDALPRRTAMAAGLAGIGAAATIVASSQGIVMFTIGLLLLGPAKVVFDVGLASWVTDHVEYERRGRVVGITETSWALGLLVGVTVMGLVASATSWRWGYATGALAVAVMAVLVGMRLDPDPLHTDRHEARSNAGRTPRRALWMVATMFCLTGAAQCLFATFGPWWEDEFDYRPAALAAVGFGLGLGELMSSSLSAARTDRWGKERSVVLGCALMVPSALAMFLADASTMAGLALLALFMMGFEFAIVSALPIVANMVPGAPGRGLGLGMGGATSGRAALAIPAVALYEHHGFGASAALGGVLAVLTAVCVTGFARASRSTVEVAAAQPR